MQLAIIVAMTDEGVIGKDNHLPWHLPEDLKRFKQITMGHTLIMGRKTWESLPKKPLPGRTNIVLSRQADYQASGATVCPSLMAALAHVEADLPVNQTAFVMGGASLFTEALSLADVLYLTLIHHKFVGDTYFPEYTLEPDFVVTAQSKHEHVGTGGDDPSFAYTYIKAERQEFDAA